MNKTPSVSSCARPRQAGFALLVAIIFMSVMLAFGLALGSLSYKQQLLASGSLESQAAFYAANSGLECLLYADQRDNLYAYTSDPTATPPLLMCDGAYPVSVNKVSQTADRWVISSRLSLDGDTHCADIMISKPNGTGTTYLYAQGYNISCTVLANSADARFSARGLAAHY